MSIRTVARTFVVALVAMSLGAGAAHAAAGIAVSPNAELGDDQFVKVDWTGMLPNQVVYFRQCKASPAVLETDCTPMYSDTGFSNASGAGTLYEHVTEGDVLAQGGGTFTCTSASACSLGVFSSTTLDSGAFAKVAFEPGLSQCPKAKGASISGGGSDLARQTLYRWGLDLCRAPHLLSVGYVPANASDGRRNFVTQLSDFAVTTTAFTAAEQKQLDTAKQTITYAPISTSGLVLAYKIFDQDPEHSGVGAQVTDLRLSPSDVARIFTGKVVGWNRDAEIVSRNPGHRFPPTIRPLVRGDHSEATELFTAWLTATAADALPEDWTGKQENYPLAYLTQDAGIVGGDKLAGVIADPKRADFSNDYFGVGYIGYVDSQQAQYYGLPTARIANASGAYVAATPTSVAAAISAAKVDAKTKLIDPDFEDLGATSYPLPVVTYATVPSTAKDAAKLTTLRAFLAFVAGDGQKSLPDGSFPLPPKLRAITAAAAKATTKDATDTEADTENDTATDTATTTGGGSSLGASPASTAPADLGAAPDPVPAADAATGEAGDAADTKAAACDTEECDVTEEIAALPAAALEAVPRWAGIPALLLAVVALAIVGSLLEFGWSVPAAWAARIPFLNRRQRSRA